MVIPQLKISRFALSFMYFWFRTHDFINFSIKILDLWKITSNIKIYHNAIRTYENINIVEEKGDPHFECFMVSDQLQAFHKNGLIYEKETHDNYFDLITTKSESNSEIPTFLR